MPIIRKRRLANIAVLAALSFFMYLILFSTSSRTRHLRQFIEKRSIHGKLSFANSKCFLQKLEFNNPHALSWLPPRTTSCQSTRNFIQLDTDYMISLDIKSLTIEYNLNDGSLIQCHAFLVKEPEKKYDLTLKNEFRTRLLRAGVYKIVCMKHMESVVIYETVETVLPLNMSNLVADANQPPLKSPACQSHLINGQRQSSLNVLVIVLEDISNNQFRRVLPKTYKFLEGQSETVLFDNLMVVGEDSENNLLSMLTGSEHDDGDMLWKNFETLGYVSMYNDAVNGLDRFKNRQVNHDTDEFWQAWNSLKSIDKTCPNRANVFMSQVSKFIKQMHRQQQPYISINIFNDPDNNEQIDEMFQQHLLDLDSNSYLTNTLVMLMSDRAGSMSTFSSEAFSQFAALEFPNLFLSMRLPKIFRSTALATQMHSNRNKLLTPFDLYKTLKHYNLIVKNGVKCDLNVNALESLKRGKSLFQEIAQNRSCQEASIPTNVCPCIDRFDIDEEQFRKETELELLDIGNFILMKLNEHTESVRSLCKRFRLNSVQSSKKVLLNGHTDKNVYEFVILLQPGQALFKALIEIEDYGLIKLRSPIERLNSNVHSKCLKTDYTSLKDSCYCKNQILIV